MVYFAFNSNTFKSLSKWHKHVTSFSSISYYSTMRLISKLELEQSSHSIILDIHASANERPQHTLLFVLKIG